jgi:TonB family protein
VAGAAGRAPAPGWTAAAVVLAANLAAYGEEPPSTAGAPVTPEAGDKTFSIPPPHPLDNAAQIDQVIAALHERIWALHAYCEQETLRDGRGRTCFQDIDQWLLTPEHEARLKALGSIAKAAKDDKAASAALKEAAALLDQERYLGVVLSGYWWGQKLAAHHAANLKALEDQVPQEERRPVEARLAMSAAVLGAQLPMAMAAHSPEVRSAATQQLYAAQEELLRAYNMERGHLADKISKQKTPQDIEASARARQTPCPTAAVTTSGSAKPDFVKQSLPDTERFYPTESRRDSFEGGTVIRVWIAASGCTQKAAVVSSSGVGALDEAALGWTQQVQFLPAELDHKPVDGVMMFRVKFSLR